MKVTKRDGRVVDFDKRKIEIAIQRAFKSVDGEVSEYALDKSENIADYIEREIKDSGVSLTIEEIQDRVEDGLMRTKRKDVAKAYVLYRDMRTRNRGNTTDTDIEEVVMSESEYWAGENSNKNSKIVTTQRDYIAGVTSTDITRRKLLTQDIVEAHDNGIIHFHDADYFLQLALTNCELVNLDDMLQNGTVLNGVRIDRPNKFTTASTVATQIIQAVTSSTYGGCTITLTHLAPFIRDSFLRRLKEGTKHVARGDGILEDIINGKIWEGYSFIESNYPKLYNFAIEYTKKDIEDGVQTFNYQVNSMTNTNGQAPFLTVFMYLGETEEYKDELAWCIEEFLNQRILGFKNKDGIYITPAFPKLIYVLEEDNITEGSKYWDLTVLAAKCTAKRMVPDYISEKKMLELKGDVYPCINKICA